ncbi:O-methyltransferase [Clostridium peptidivorans]|uniref:O-methyltransferase n=1 Tax=Clostridium peptidivorans TaxID=100174 RepID=UPI000BE385D4|nr:O-methyltransferase [Clostridium peptidivorans]
MSTIAYDYMEEFIRSLIKGNNEKLEALEKYARNNSVPIIHEEVGRFLELMIDIRKPLKILELGTAIGYSAILMASVSKGSFHIDTIERDPEMIKQAKENIESFGFKENIDILEGDCLEILEKLNEKYDLIFMDAGKGHYNHFLPHCLRLLNKEGIIVADNVLFRGMVASDKLIKRRKITIVKRMREFLNMVSEDDFITSVIPMGDGVAVIKRRFENE